jgi:hypothetical protein
MKAVELTGADIRVEGAADVEVGEDVRTHSPCLGGLKLETGAQATDLPEFACFTCLSFFTTNDAKRHSLLFRLAGAV